MTKKFKLKKKKKRKGLVIVVLLLIMYLIFNVVNYVFKIENIKNSDLLLNYLLKESIHINNSQNNLDDLIFNTLANFDISDPKTIFANNLSPVVSLNGNGMVSADGDDNNDEMAKLESISSYVYDPNPVEVKNPIVYLYNTHQLENYSNYNLELYNIKPTVMMAAFLLREKLNAKGVPTVVETMNITEFIKANGWNYDDSYKASRIFTLDAKNKYSTIKYYIDLHRDSTSKELSTIKISGKNYARVLFVIGTNHNDFQKNLDVSTKLSNYINSSYEGLSRGVLQKGGTNIRGIYNQDLSPNAMLIEVGGVYNTIEEVINTIEVLSDILSKHIKEDTL